MTSFFDRDEYETQRAAFFDDSDDGDGSGANSDDDEPPAGAGAPVAATPPAKRQAAAAGAAAGPSAKKAAPTKTAKQGKPFKWRVMIATPQTFKTSVTIMCRILSQCSFQVIRSAGFTGLRVDSIDSSHVCMIKASYECDIESSVNLANEMFCVDTKMFNTLLKDVQPGHILTLTRFLDAHGEDSADLTLDSFARDDSSNRFTCTLNILDEESNVPRMQPITYDFMVEMDLARLKSYCKMAQELNSSHMEFKILQPPPELMEATEDEDGGVQQHLFFVVGASGDGGGAFQRIFHSVITVEGGGGASGGSSSATTTPDEAGRAHVTIRAVSCDFSLGTGPSGADIDFAAVQHTFTEKYAEVFSTSYLNLVLKSMDRQTVQLFMSKSLPLVVRYGLGNDFSHVKVILAPRVRDANDDDE
jgi:hypothetical protein